MSEFNEFQASYRESHVDGGENYDRAFEDRYTAMLWLLEQLLIDRYIKKFCHGKEIEALDIACGTGRILKFIAPKVGSITGVDVSPTMLGVLRENQPANATIIEADITRDCNSLRDKRFDLITAFRFFAGAEPDLRDDMFEAVKPLLKPGGIFIFNNHRNSDALARKITKMLGIRRSGRHRSMSRREMHDLIALHKFRIVDEKGVGSLPFGSKFMPFPTIVLANLENALSRTNFAKAYGRYNLYCAQKAD